MDRHRDIYTRQDSLHSPLLPTFKVHYRNFSLYERRGRTSEKGRPTLPTDREVVGRTNNSTKILLSVYTTSLFHLSRRGCWRLEKLSVIKLQNERRFRLTSVVFIIIVYITFYKTNFVALRFVTYFTIMNVFFSF